MQGDSRIDRPWIQHTPKFNMTFIVILLKKTSFSYNNRWRSMKFPLPATNIFAQILSGYPTGRGKYILTWRDAQASHRGGKRISKGRNMVLSTSFCARAAMRGTGSSPARAAGRVEGNQSEREAAKHRVRS